MSKSLAARLASLFKADEAAVQSVLADVALEKAAQNLEPGEHVKDRWEQGQMHASATKEEVKTGPTQEASGGGAEKMVRNYSNPAPQHGVAIDPEPLARMLGQLAASSKAILEGQSALIQGIISLKAEFATLKSGASTAVLADASKAKKGESEDEEDEEEAEVVEINAARGKSLLSEAKKAIAKIAILKGDLEDETDRAARKTIKSEIKKLEKIAGNLLFNARSCAFAAGDVEMKKSIRTMATKADINVVQEEEEEEEEEGEGKSKKAVENTDSAVDKAKTNDKGNQADSANKDGNQADHAKSLTTMQQKIEDSLKGLTMLSTDVRGMMDVIAGKSKVESLSPEIAKAKPAAIEQLPEIIRQKEATGELTENDAYAANDIAGQVRHAMAGRIDKTIVENRIAKSSSAVRQLFAGLNTGLNIAA